MSSENAVLMQDRDAMLLDFAETLGVSIEYVTHIEGDDGQYSRSRKTIRLREGMHARHHRSVLAHELAHAVFDDAPSRFGPVNAKQERRADEWAALRLIDRMHYRAAEAMHENDIASIALELGVMQSIVRAYQSILLRVGETVYVKPRMGTGQWVEKVAADA